MNAKHLLLLALPLLVALPACDPVPVAEYDTERSLVGEAPAPASGVGFQYEIVNIHPVGAPHSTATAISDNGQHLAVAVESTGFVTGYRYSGGATTLLDRSPGAATTPTDINDAGTVIGVHQIPATPSDTVHWPLVGPRQVLAQPPGDDGFARAINNLDVAVGPMGSGVAGLWSGLSFVETIAATNACDEEDALDVNDLDEVVGWSAGNCYADDSHGWYWQRGSGLDPVYLPLPGGAPDDYHFTRAEAINNIGELAGVYTDMSFVPHGVYWPSYDAAPVEFGNLGGNWSEVNDINDAGIIVGSSRYSGGGTDTRGYLWHHNYGPASIVLDDLLVDPSCEVLEANGIDADGNIAAAVSCAGGPSEAAILMRVDTPEDCGDGLDNDADGDIDCEDNECALSSSCVTPCTTNLDCASGYVCEALGAGCDDGLGCVPGCRGKGDCPVGEQCVQEECFTCPCPAQCM